MRWLRTILGLAKRDAWIAELERELLNWQRRFDARPAVRRFTVPPPTTGWTAGDCEALRSFFQKETGRKLLEICGAHALHEAMKECAGDKAAPLAAGMDAMLRFQFNLASESVRQKLSDESADSDSKTAEREQDAAQPVEIRRSF